MIPLHRLGNLRHGFMRLLIPFLLVMALVLLGATWYARVMRQRSIEEFAQNVVILFPSDYYPDYGTIKSTPSHVTSEVFDGAVRLMSSSSASWLPDTSRFSVFFKSSHVDRYIGVSYHANDGSCRNVLIVPISGPNIEDQGDQGDRDQGARSPPD